MNIFHLMNLASNAQRAQHLVQVLFSEVDTFDQLIRIFTIV